MDRALERKTRPQVIFLEETQSHLGLVIDILAKRFPDECIPEYLLNIDGWRRGSFDSREQRLEAFTTAIDLTSKHFYDLDCVELAKIFRMIGGYFLWDINFKKFLSAFPGGENFRVSRKPQQGIEDNYDGWVANISARKRIKFSHEITNIYRQDGLCLIPPIQCHTEIVSFSKDHNTLGYSLDLDHLAIKFFFEDEIDYILFKVTHGNSVVIPTLTKKA